MPTWRATASAVARRSPVSITTSRPSARSAATASRDGRANRHRRSRSRQAATASCERRTPPSVPSRREPLGVARAARRDVDAVLRAAMPALPTTHRGGRRRAPRRRCPGSLANVGRVRDVEATLARGGARSPRRADAPTRARPPRPTAAATSSRSAPAPATIVDHRRPALGQRAGLVEHDGRRPRRRAAAPRRP